MFILLGNILLNVHIIFIAVNKEILLIHVKIQKDTIFFGYCQILLFTSIVLSQLRLKFLHLKRMKCKKKKIHSKCFPPSVK